MNVLPFANCMPTPGFNQPSNPPESHDHLGYGQVTECVVRREDGGILLAHIPQAERQDPAESALTRIPETAVVLINSMSAIMRSLICCMTVRK